VNINIVELETQNGGKDWPLIVMAVPCPICTAPVGSPCSTVKTPSPMLTLGNQRIDYHAERKYAAAHLWYEQREVAQASKLAAAQAAESPELITSSDVSGEATAESPVSDAEAKDPVQEAPETLQE
jgi:hypothetical protein